MFAQGNRSQAEQIIEQQLQKSRSLSNLLDATSATHNYQKLNQKYRQEALGMAWKQVKTGADAPLPWVAIGTLSLQANKRDDFVRARDELLKKHPNDGHGHYFDGIVRLQEGDWEGAEQALRKAESLGIPEESINEYLRMAIDGQKWIWEYAQLTLYALGAWLIGLVVLYLVGKSLSARTLRIMNRRGVEAATTSHNKLRSLYRFVVNISGLYYYISLPLLMLAAVALPLSIGYALLMLPSVSLFLIVVVLAAGLFGIVTAFTGIRTAFIRGRDEDPGRALTEAEAPGLWALAREVATDLETRPLDEIWITPGTEVAVIERGGWLKRRRDKARRALILGAGLLSHFKIDAFKAVLAHEYGHFRNRDTAGGDIALGVRRAMMNFADKIVARGKIRWWDISVHFLRIYHKLFTRLTFGASRLQEVLADRIAVLAYGPTSFKEGLDYVIRRSAEFDFEVSQSIGERIRQEKHATSFYPGRGVEVESLDELKQVINEIESQPTTEADTHPSPRDRYRMAFDVGAADKSVGKEKLISLFAKPKELCKELDASMNQLADEQARHTREMNNLVLRHIEMIMRSSPDPEPVVEGARIQMQMGRHDRAVKDLSALLRQFPDAHGLRFGRAMAYEKLNQHDKAIADMNKYLSAFGNEADAQMLCSAAEVHRKAGKLDMAKELLRRALKADKNSLSAIALRGRVNQEQGDAAGAIADFEHVLKREPRCKEVRLALDRAKQDLAGVATEESV